MKRMMSIAVIALLMAGSSAFACDGCGCKEKKAEKKATCSSTNTTSCSKSEAKSCGKDCKKECCTKKADAGK